MLDFIYYPVSGILWVWHKVFGAIPFLGPDSGFTWALSVVFLVFTLRAILYKPFVKQVRTTRQMQELQPQIKALQKKYAGDRQRQAVEMQKLQKEHGFNPIMGCLPVLAQAPVFIGLFHVLRSFNRTGTGFGQLGMSVEDNANTPNYFFSVEDVQSFLSARLFGAPISAAITTPSDQLEAFAIYGPVPTMLNIAAVAIPLMVIASVATHFNSRASVARQSPEAAANPQSAIMNKLALWIFPLGVLVGGPFLPIAILLYWVSNNIWTYAQQHIVFRKIDAEEEEKKQAALARRAENAPKPGARPNLSKKKKAAVDGAPGEPEVVDGVVEDDASEQPTGTVSGDGSPTGTSKPKPGARPQTNRGKSPKRKRR
ncbi:MULTISPECIES: membrane protein insertase YidC [Rhodococcus]|uniref:Membrane protein insertase YidC n=1 Tax=Rhodococcus oxybenzonivorans TaxID=1990687 RepID=A0AAE4V432_9NOCA|nr:MULTISPECIES: membrane protein insertase YidC [Rhodococcus]MDV7246046.1 membrane protein insertase YidC [Rhodococcus oxybenzonivorans]MDV7267897.1 membrane protein insertase YidC [Rhodococcus oxybenzonivorans]MDV7277641.1 membrane protein insertase YidC [Rhodococcus oxybenzonivorans]MDV7337059.1 membrane protein insertase YidC [Rhodococcus oxybenzonivorans]MDV7347347.1 membrane protein insertase YidC [Rhodococcus oxybenzonivorans]